MLMYLGIRNMHHFTLLLHCTALRLKTYCTLCERFIALGEKKSQVSIALVSFKRVSSSAYC